MPKKNIGISTQIRKIDFEHIDTFLKICNIDLPASVLLELFKANFFSDYINDNTTNEAFYNFVTRFDSKDTEKAEKLFKSEMALLRKIEYLYQIKNTEVIKEFLRRVRANHRSRIVETFDLNNIETYVYYIILNAKKKNKRIANKEIIYYLKHYKGYDIISDYGVEQTIKKVRKKIAFDLFKIKKFST